MAKKGTSATAAKPDVSAPPGEAKAPPPAHRPSALLDTRVVYCRLRRAQSSRDCLEQLRSRPGGHPQPPNPRPSEPAPRQTTGGGMGGGVVHRAQPHIPLTPPRTASASWERSS